MDIDSEIAAFEGMRGELESKHTGKWVLIESRSLVGVFDSFDEAAKVAAGRFGRGPYLIRQVGARPVVMPASLMFAPTYG